ncbi:FadR/GntR family transcriptional regulator [Mycolicibacterium sp. P9-22]|uniref:FadR/GntR family transcriptional regulator n=1 Tax=Mycolicibacterium sp. P9-22 TaxID=2024613 RepID=UPI0011EF656B|nr:FCD domain-containing protein [Mycolicibacterium sp. P9-22]KAA0120606.1 FadR family transcriptional regulator [Mycolicibacterium sp. P9-22]
MARATLNVEIVESIGRDIASGQIEEGAALNTESLMALFDVSRTAMREALKVLESMGLIEMKRRTGMRVRRMPDWNTLDPRIIRWRLTRPDRAGILRSVTELRESIEPTAARIAATDAPEADRRQLGPLVDAMAEAIRRGDRAAFLDADLRFHDAVLTMSGNELFIALSRSVRGVLEGQTESGVLPVYDVARTIDRHRAIADAIAVADSVAAESAARALFADMRHDIESPHS